MSAHMALMVEDLADWETHHPGLPKPLADLHCTEAIIRSKLKALLQGLGCKASTTDLDISLKMLHPILQELYDPLEAWGREGPPIILDEDEEELENQDNEGEDQEPPSEPLPLEDEEEAQAASSSQQHFSETPPGTQPPRQH